MSDQPAVLHVRPDAAADTSERGLPGSVRTVGSHQAVQAALAESVPDYVVCDHAPDAGVDGVALLTSVRETHPDLPVLLCTDEPNGSLAARATRHGVTEYVVRSETDPADRIRDLASTARGAVQTQSAALEALSELTANHALSDAETISRVLDIGTDRLGLSIGFVSRIEDGTHRITNVVGDHPAMEAGLETALSDTYCSRTVEAGGIFDIQDAAAEGWADHPSYQNAGLACYLGGEVRVDGALYGTLCFADESARADPFSESQRTFMDLLTTWLGQELERRNRERELERYENIIEAVDDGVYALDDEGHFEFVNSTMTELTGYDAEELLGAHTSLVKTPDVVEEAESVVRGMLFGDHEDGEEATFELSLQRADGEVFPAEDHMTLLWDDEDPEWFTGTAGVIRDITERRERERELESAKSRIEQILGRIGAAFFAVDDEWTLTYWNSRAEEVLGREAGDVLGENLWDVFPEALDATFYDAYHRAMETQEPVTFEEYYPPIGKWFRVNAYPSAEGLSVYFNDITDQKERDRRLSGLLETTRSLMQAHSPEAVAETVVEAAESVLGFELNVVRLHDPEAGTLYPMAGSDALPDRPVYDADEGFPGEAFQRGESIRIDDFDRIEHWTGDTPNAAMYVPLDDHGVLSVALRERAAFTEADVSVAEILASNAAAALDRVTREQELRRYETVIENVRDMVYVIDSDGTFQLVTEPLAEWLGYDRAELRGRDPGAVLDSEDRDAFASQIRNLRDIDPEGTFTMETTLLTADGGERPAEIEVSLIEDDIFRGSAGVVRDLTELKQAREELRDERDRFSYLFNNLPDAVVETELVEEDAVIRSVNPAFAEVFGTDSAVLGSGLEDTVVPPADSDANETDRFVEHGTAGESIQSELRRRTADGYRDFLFRGIPYRRDDGRLWSFGIYTDITEQKERQRRLEVLNRVLRHNLRNDLTVVMGLADELSDRLDDAARLDLLDRLRGKAGQIASLSDRAREIERSVSRQEADTDPLDIPAAVDSLVETYERQYDPTIELSLPDEPAHGGDGRFRRALGELIENSLEHGGAAPNIDVTVTTAPDTVSVTVADDGPGIPDHELAVLTGDEPITQLSHGSGLGLWLVIWLAESYGGRVQFDDDDGAVVTVTMPRTDS